MTLFYQTKDAEPPFEGAVLVRHGWIERDWTEDKEWVERWLWKAEVEDDEGCHATP